jgi:hypothetical protein
VNSLPPPLDRASKNGEGVGTPKPMIEVHQTTIIEENETMRGSIERHPGAFKKMAAKKKAA